MFPIPTGTVGVYAAWNDMKYIPTARCKASRTFVADLILCSFDGFLALTYR